MLTPVDRDQLLADTKAFAETEGAPGITIEAVVREGSTASEILEQATGMPADLLVIGTHGRSGFERLVLGSVAERVLRKASCPVLTVPKGLPNAAPSGPALYKRILCPVDFSDSSLHALKYAISMAQEADGQLRCCMSWRSAELENAADMARHPLRRGHNRRQFREAAVRRLSAGVSRGGCRPHENYAAWSR